MYAYRRQEGFAFGTFQCARARQQDRQNSNWSDLDRQHRQRHHNPWRRPYTNAWLNRRARQPCWPPNPVEALASDIGYLNLLAGAEATATLMRGFTTIRDMGGPIFGLKRAIDEGLLPGPRIYPSGAVITITSGHGDFRSLSDRTAPIRAAMSANDPTQTLDVKI